MGCISYPSPGKRYTPAMTSANYVHQPTQGLYREYRLHLTDPTRTEHHSQNHKPHSADALHLCIFIKDAIGPRNSVRGDRGDGGGPLATDRLAQGAKDFGGKGEKRGGRKRRSAKGAATRKWRAQRGGSRDSSSQQKVQKADTPSLPSSLAPATGRARGRSSSCCAFCLLSEESG